MLRFLPLAATFVFLVSPAGLAAQKSQAPMCEFVFPPQVGNFVRKDATTGRAYHFIERSTYARVYLARDSATGQNLSVLKVYDSEPHDKEFDGEPMIYGGFDRFEVARADVENLELIRGVVNGQADTFKVVQVLQKQATVNPAIGQTNNPIVEYEFVHGQTLESLVDDVNIDSSTRSALLKKYNKFLNRLNALMLEKHPDLIFDSNFSNRTHADDAVDGQYKTALVVEFSDSKEHGYPGVNGLGIVPSNIMVTPELDLVIVAPH